VERHLGLSYDYMRFACGHAVTAHSSILGRAPAQDREGVPPAGAAGIRLARHRAAAGGSLEHFWLPDRRLTF
jgi:hypothetical protein